MLLFAIFGRNELSQISNKKVPITCPAQFSHQQFAFFDFYLPVTLNTLTVRQLKKVGSN